MKASEVLLRAKEAIIERGWCQHEYENTKGQVCSYGAINTVTGEYTEMRVVAETYLREAIGTFGVGMWNDDPDRTKDEVIAAFDKAIALAVAAGE